MSKTSAFVLGVLGGLGIAGGVFLSRSRNPKTLIADFVDWGINLWSWVAKNDP